MTKEEANRYYNKKAIADKKTKSDYNDDYEDMDDDNLL